MKAKDITKMEPKRTETFVKAHPRSVKPSASGRNIVG